MRHVAGVVLMAANIWLVAAGIGLIVWFALQGIDTTCAHAASVTEYFSYLSDPSYFEGCQVLGWNLFLVFVRIFLLGDLHAFVQCNFIQLVIKSDKGRTPLLSACFNLKRVCQIDMISKN